MAKPTRERIIEAGHACVRRVGIRRLAMEEVPAVAPAPTPVEPAVVPLTQAELAVLRYVVAGAYYLAVDVRAALDYRSGDVTPVRALTFPEYLEEGLLDHLLEDIA